MKAMIFAAGLGKRLGTITRDIPKALVDINGKTALHLAVEKCSGSGFNDIIINVHHFADMVEEEVEKLNKMGYRISVSDEREMLLENGGGLYKAGAFSTVILFCFTMLTLFQILISRLFIDCILKRRVWQLWQSGTGLAKGFFLSTATGRLQGLEKYFNRGRDTGREYDSGLSEIAFSSMHIAEPEIFNYMTEGIYTLIDLYLRLAADHRIYTLKHDEGYWVDVGTPESLELVRKLL